MRICHLNDGAQQARLAEIAAIGRILPERIILKLICVDD